MAFSKQLESNHGCGGNTMTLEGWGIRLETLNSDTAEQVRVWRNSPEISSQMEYREFITPEMQKEWFESVQRNQYAYFLIYSSMTPVGMIHLAHINVSEKTAESGLFIGNKNFVGTGVALAASLLLLDYAFTDLGLDTIFAKVKDDNISAEKYNILLGFSKINTISPGFNGWELNKETYFSKRMALVPLLA